MFGPDVVIARAGQAGYLGFAECKWCREDKIYETLWDLLKLAVALARTHAEHAYLIVGAPAEPWGRGGLCAELIADGAWTARELFEHYRRAWQWLLKATRALPRPGAGRDRDRAAGCGPDAPRRRARLGAARRADRRSGRRVGSARGRLAGAVGVSYKIARPGLRPRLAGVLDLPQPPHDTWRTVIQLGCRTRVR